MSESSVVVERVNGRGVAFIRISGRVDERFDAAQLGALDVPLALELSGVRAVTSFGVRQFTGALAGLSPLTPAYLLECPPCFVDQLNLVQGFIGAAEVLTARALFSCGCGAEVEETIDVLSDGARIRSGRPPEPACHNCGTPMRLVEDDSLRFVAHKGARRLDPRVGAMLTQLGLYTPAAQEDRSLSVQKVVDGANVALRLEGGFGEQHRLARMADDDGIVILLIAGLILRGVGAAAFEQLLATLGNSAKELVLRDVPPQIVSLVSVGALSLGAAKIASLLQPVRCGSCDELSLASTSPFDDVEAPRCPRCGQPAVPVTKTPALDLLVRGGEPSVAARALLDRVDGLFSQAAVEARLVTRPRGAASANADLPAQIGGYKILRSLSAGGMAEVLLATRGSLGGVEKLVALKRFRRDLFQSAPAAIAMFLAEARLAAQLSHPNVVQIFDVGESEGDLFMAMELIDGRDLRELIDLGQPVPAPIVAHIGLELARALAYLHEARDLRGRTLKIVHRDVSPQNVLVDKSGRVVLIDFGVALAGEGELQQRRRKVAGNLAFMSPEQCYGEPLDGRSDLFSLGVVLWELLSAAPLFRRHDAEETRRALLAGKIPPLPAAPPALEALVRRLLSPEREKRPTSAEVVAGELDAMLPALGGRMTPAELGAFMSLEFSPRAEEDRARRSGEQMAVAMRMARQAAVRPSLVTRHRVMLIALALIAVGASAAVVGHFLSR